MKCNVAVILASQPKDNELLIKTSCLVEKENVNVKIGSLVESAISTLSGYFSQMVLLQKNSAVLVQNVIFNSEYLR